MHPVEITLPRLEPGIDDGHQIDDGGRRHVGLPAASCAGDVRGARGVGVHQLPPHKRRQDPSTTGAVDPG